MAAMAHVTCLLRMALKERIKVDLTSAMKGGNELIRSTLRVLLAALITREKEKRYKLVKEESGLAEQALLERAALTDEEIVAVLFSEIKKRKEAIVEFKRGNREDLVEREKAEILVLERYRPELLSEEELKNMVQEAVEQVAARSQKDMGKVMGVLMPKIKGRADGETISSLVKKVLLPESS